MPVFTVRFDTGFKSTAADDELVSAFATITAAGGSDVSVVRDEWNERPRAEFSLEAVDRPSAVIAVGALLAGLMEATPSVAGGWVLASLVAA
jgi:hypothetical protein